MKKMLIWLVVLACMAFGAQAEIEYSMGPLVGEPADYTDIGNWMQVPEITKEADTVYFYPTSYFNYEADAPEICEIDDPLMRTTAITYIARNASAFDASTNVFAPYYRQINLAKAAEDYEKQMVENVTRTDVYAALDYYFEHYNDGRPFILAGHSQGSQVVRMVVKDYMAQHPDYYERMIAAYVLGYSVTQSDLENYPHLKFAEGETDTGVIVAWNIEGEGNENSVLVLPGAISINPINWKRDDTYAPAEDNLGDHIYDAQTGAFTEHVPGLADARVDVERGVVICTTGDLPFISDTAQMDVSGLFGKKSYHNGDYDFYYRNIEENAVKRVEAFLSAR